MSVLIPQPGGDLRHTAVHFQAMFGSRGMRLLPGRTGSLQTSSCHGREIVFGAAVTLHLEPQDVAGDTASCQHFGRSAQEDLVRAEAEAREVPSGLVVLRAIDCLERNSALQLNLPLTTSQQMHSAKLRQSIVQEAELPGLNSLCSSVQRVNMSSEVGVAMPVASWPQAA